MKAKTNRQPLLLLPHSFKYVGGAIVAFALVVGGITSPKLGLDLPINSISTTFGSKVFFINTLIVGLLFLVLAKDKMEDELTIKIRFQAMAFAFLTGAIQTVLNPILNYLMNISLEDQLEETSASGMLLGMLVMFLLMKTFLKFTR